MTLLTCAKLREAVVFNDALVYDYHEIESGHEISVTYILYIMFYRKLSDKSYFITSYRE